MTLAKDDVVCVIVGQGWDTPRDFLENSDLTILYEYAEDDDNCFSEAAELRPVWVALLAVLWIVVVQTSLQF